MDKSNHSVQSIQSNGSVKSVLDEAEKAERLKKRKKYELKLIRKYDRYMYLSVYVSMPNIILSLISTYRSIMILI
jgi:hypothetical protein